MDLTYKSKCLLKNIISNLLLRNKDTKNVHTYDTPASSIWYHLIAICLRNIYMTIMCFAYNYRYTT